MIFNCIWIWIFSFNFITVSFWIIFRITYFIWWFFGTVIRRSVCSSVRVSFSSDISLSVFSSEILKVSLVSTIPSVMPENNKQYTYYNNTPAGHYIIHLPDIILNLTRAWCAWTAGAACGPILFAWGCARWLWTIL